MQALDIADEYNMETVRRNATSTVHEILLLNKGLQTIHCMARGYFQLSFRARFIWKHKMRKCLFYEFVIE